jgi:hypothetical protein
MMIRDLFDRRYAKKDIMANIITVYEHDVEPELASNSIVTLQYYGSLFVSKNSATVDKLEDELKKSIY